MVKIAALTEAPWSQGSQRFGGVNYAGGGSWSGGGGGGGAF